MGSNITLVIGIILLAMMTWFAYMFLSVKPGDKAGKKSNVLNLNIGENDRVEVSSGKNGAINLTVIPVHVDNDGIPVPDLDENEMTSSSGLNREFWEKVLNRDTLSVSDLHEINEKLALHGFSTGHYHVTPPEEIGSIFDIDEEDIRRGGVPEDI